MSQGTCQLDRPPERMDRESYRQTYLRSAHWAGVRQAALERAGHRCQVCNADHRLDVHHRTYERVGRESPMDVTVLCRPCHDLFHDQGKLGAGRTAKVERPAASRVCECGCGMPVKRRYVSGHFQRQQKRAARANARAKVAARKRRKGLS